MKTFYIAVELEAGVTVEQKDDWLSDPTIAKTISIGELTKEEIKQIKRTIKNNISWTFSETGNMTTEKITRRDNIFTIKCEVATDDIEKAIKELKKFYENSYDGKWINTDREIKNIPSPEQYDNEEIIYNLDLVLRLVNYKQGEDINPKLY
jgi:hypothetical protein